MNIRCAFCQTPYSIGRVEKLDALQHMYANNLSHYDAHCPRCRRATPVQRQKLELTMPNWREALTELEKELSAHPQQAALSKAGPDTAPQAESQSEEPAPAKESTKAKRPARQETGRPQAARAELGRKPPARNTPAGKKKSK